MTSSRQRLSRSDASDTEDRTAPWKDFSRVLDQMVDLLQGTGDEGRDGGGARGGHRRSAAARGEGRPQAR